MAPLMFAIVSKFLALLPGAKTKLESAYPKPPLRRKCPKPAPLVPARNRRAYIYAWQITDDAQNGILPSETDFAVVEHGLETATVRNPLMCKGLLSAAHQAAGSNNGLGLTTYLMDQLTKHLAK